MSKTAQRMLSLPRITLCEAFHASVERHPKKTALLFKGDDGEFRKISFQELSDRVDHIAAFLGDFGIRKGERVAIFAYHGAEWVIADLAILHVGGVVVPLYHTISPVTARYILNDSKAKFIFVGSDEILSAVAGIKNNLPSLKGIVTFNCKTALPHGMQFSFSDLLKEREGRKLIHEDLPIVLPDDTATIVYTSGTTGEPKGVMLSHFNIVSNVFSGIKRFGITNKDVFLSFLPLSHMFERTAGCYTMLFAGVPIAYAGDLTTIVQDVQKIKPTILITVPRVLEKVYQAVENKVMEGRAINRKLVLRAVQCLNRYVNLEYKRMKMSPLLRLRCWFYNRLVAARFRKIAGGRLRLLVSGGAPLDRRLSKTLYLFGFNILEGYGLTETSPIVSCSLPDDNRLGTVGKPFDNVEVKIAENDEILVRGPNVMKGYLNRPEETARAIDREGWFRTGDRGSFDQYGNLMITGRIKELIVTSYGKKVAPLHIEAEIKKSSYIDQVMLYGDNRKYIVALIVPRREAIESYAKGKGIVTTSHEELLKREEIRELIAGEIGKATADCAQYEKVKAFRIIAEGFTQANDLLTPTLKLRRDRIIEKHRKEIESMYAQAEGR